MKFKVRDRHVIASLIVLGVLVLASSCKSEEMRERGKNIRICLEDHTPEECVLLFPPPECANRKDEVEDD
jgi:hypothetical protein